MSGTGFGLGCCADSTTEIQLYWLAKEEIQIRQQSQMGFRISNHSLVDSGERV